MRDACTLAIRFRVANSKRLMAFEYGKGLNMDMKKAIEALGSNRARNREGMNMDWETRHDMIATHAWEKWTNNGLNLDDDDRWQTERHVQDASNNAYLEGMGDQEWLDATLILLKVT